MVFEFSADKPALVLAPMAGITNRVFRELARTVSAEFYPSSLDALYVSEMITSRALIERDRETLKMIEFGPTEKPRSLQLYGVDPKIVGAAARMVADEDLADHIDLNMGCPVPKVTRKGGGSALPWKRDLFRAIIRAAVKNSGGRPVTVKMRKGIDPDHITYLEAGRTAAEEGVAWVALHGRTTLDLYSGKADWSAISRLVETLQPLGVPVLGNGDVWSGGDAKRMLAETGCAGVVIGRGCLGRPWLLGEIGATLNGEIERVNPDFQGVASVMRRHAAGLVEFHNDEAHGCREFRKHVSWYTKGFNVGGETRHALAMIPSLSELDRLLDSISNQPYPEAVAYGPRGRTNAQKSVALPDGWLDSQELPADMDLSAAELDVSGG